MSYKSVGATTNFSYNYTLLSGGRCYDTVAKKEVAQSFCAGDLAVSPVPVQPKPLASLYAWKGNVCINQATGKPADAKWCPKSTLDKILDGFALFGQSQQQQAAPTSSVPKWVLPVGLAAAGLGLVLIVTKPKKSAPVSNPARRRLTKYRVELYIPATKHHARKSITTITAYGRRAADAAGRRLRAKAQHYGLPEAKIGTSAR